MNLAKQIANKNGNKGSIIYLLVQFPCDFNQLNKFRTLPLRIVA